MILMKVLTKLKKNNTVLIRIKYANNENNFKLRVSGILIDLGKDVHAHFLFNTFNIKPPKDLKILFDFAFVFRY